MYEGQVKCIQGFLGNPEGKTPLGNPRHRLVNYVHVCVHVSVCVCMYIYITIT
jgi:hypothetical protein